jgi:putative membrane protein
MHDGWFGWWPLGGLLWLLVVGLAVVGVIAVARRLLGRTDGFGANSGSRKVLDERYARGEIDREEYLQRRKDIGA